ncbi:endonuclease/exonuclease/phosphatase family protein [Desulfocicer niacini]
MMTLPENKHSTDRRGFLKKLSRSHWLSRLLDLPICSDNPATIGLILIQIDGLSQKQFKTALENRRMPFLKKLLEEDTHTLRPGYSGLPSSTPAYQAELMYGVKSFVPAFEFIDRRTDRRHVSYKPESANQMAQELVDRGEPLLTGGNAYATLFSGGAEEARYCSETMDLNSILDTLNPLKLILLFFLHANMLLRIVSYALIECGLAVFDFFRGLFAKQDIIKEFTFIPARVVVCIILRELVRFRLKLDVTRGVPLLCANFLGYDEQAHRRGPSSAFAHWSLKGIDQAIRDIHKSAMASQCRSYRMIIYSDHGQEKVINYEIVHGVSVKNAIRNVFLNRLDPDQAVGVDTREQMGQIRITTMGPIGHVYLPMRISSKDLEKAAEKLVTDAGIPLVFFRKNNEAWVCDNHGTFRLAKGADRILGTDHPYPDRVIEDLENISCHKNAGDLVISGWRANDTPLSFSNENGAHGGPGKNETHPFLLIPSEIIRDQLPVFRASDLRQLVLTQFKHLHNPKTVRSAPAPLHELQIVSFNIHSCKGMNGRFHPERTLSLLSEMDPDIVALQEVDVKCKRTHYLHQAAFLASRLGMTYHFHPLMERSEGRYGIAILSRFPLSDVKCSRFSDLSGRRSKEPRGLIVAEIGTPLGPVQVINTHLGLNAKDRLHQTETLLKKILPVKNSDRQLPVILCGDLNAGPGTAVYKKVAARLTDVQTQVSGKKYPRATFFSWYPIRRIDHIFVSNHLKVQSVLVPRSYEARGVSDHLPVCTRLSLNVNHPDSGKGLA